MTDARALLLVTLALGSQHAAAQTFAGNEIVAGTLVSLGGELVNDRIRGLLDLPPLRSPEATAAQ